MEPDASASALAGRRLMAVRVALLVLVVGAFLALALTGSVPSVDRVRELGDDIGVAAPFVWPPLFAALNFLVPWPILAGATGLLFGVVAGTALALAGVLLATSVQFTLGRTVAGEDLRRRIRQRIPRIDAMLERNGLLAAFYSRIIPGLPWAVVNYAAGLARVRLRDLLLATVVGGTVKIFAYVALGGSFGDLSKPEAKVAIVLLVLLALGGLVVARRGLPGQPPPPAT